jgi:hypothetical protein
MGGFIKVTLREEDKVTTKMLYTDSLDSILGNYENIFENEKMSEMIIEKAIDKKELTKEYHDQLDTLSPFSYGYIFIDRIKKKVWYLNNYTAISHFSNYNFNKDDYVQLKEQDFKIEIQSDYDGKTNTFKKTVVKDVRKDNVRGTRDFASYIKLSSAIPYLEEVVSIKEKIKDMSSLESILDQLMILRSERTLGRNEFINDLIITKFKDWYFLEDNTTEESYVELFNYLKEEDLLSEKDIEFWNIEIEEVKKRED